MMNETNKINQHYVPQFYLRNFSKDNNRNSIGVYIIKSNRFINSAKIKNQAAKKYYYGKDGIIEDALGGWESQQSPLIKSIIQGKLPQINTKEHLLLISLFSLLHLRNPVITKYFEELIKVCGGIEYYNSFKKNTLEEHAKLLGFKFHYILSELLADLHFKVLKNKTNIPFITSDFPVVRYNLYLEKFSQEVGSISYGVSGIKFFLPLNSKNCLILYDSTVYKIGNKKDNFVNITNYKEINQINLLQTINNNSNIFFGEGISENYLNNLILHKKKFNIKNTFPIRVNNTVLAERCINIKLKISCIKIHSKAKRIHKIIENNAPMRKQYYNLVKTGKLI